MGGSDQWGNITTGTELIRKMDGGSAYALTAPLLKKADGSKFGKSEGGNVWIDKEKTSPYKFYQYWLNASDEDAPNLIRVFTLKTQKEIEALEAEHAEAPHRRILQKALAEDVTVRVHSQADLDTALKASSLLFGKSTKEDLGSISEGDFMSVFEGVPQATVPRAAVEGGLDIVAALAGDTQFLASNGDARRALKENAISVNKEKVTGDKVITAADLPNDRYVLLQKGKKNYYVLRVD